MKFGAIPLARSDGAILAHAVKQGGVILKKGTVLGTAEIARLAAAGVETVVAAMLEPGDVDEDTAAFTLAQRLAGAGVRVEKPFTGRSNLFAEEAGILRLGRAAIDAVNGVDEAITVATLPAWKAVVAGEMVGTVKIIPFSVPGAILSAACSTARDGAIAVAPFRPKDVTIVSTLLPGLKPSVVEKTLSVMAQRLLAAGARIVGDVRVPHQTAALGEALAAAAPRSDMIIVFGASAITDRLDVIPAAIEVAGGTIEHFGMPVDPGNLLLVGRLAGMPVIGAPGCARSPRENGFDWVLARLLADVPVMRADIQALGVGGLLMEIVSRPQPRDADQRTLPDSAPLAPPRLGVILLAAGRSTRMGAQNKLLATHQGKPLVRHAAEAALAAEIGPVTVVVGHMADKVRQALAGIDVTVVVNSDFADGLSTSVKAGVAALPDKIDATLVMLGDMPLVTPAVLRRLAAVFGENRDALAVVPTTLGERGNPVLIARDLFPALAGLSGDAGARGIIEAAGERVIEVPVDDPGIHRDIDTPDALAALRAQAGQKLI